MLCVSPILALRDNYIWLITRPRNSYAVIVDPGDATPVLNTLAKQNLQLAAIFVTHHHHDHSNGVNGLLQHYSAPVFALDKEKIPGVTSIVKPNCKISIDALELEFTVITIPGHTNDHIAFFGHGFLFSGDTLFTGGCGRVFEGTAYQMYESLQKLIALPDETLIYCGHEYTWANLRFACHIEPTNPVLLARIENVLSLRKKTLPTVPATLQLEKKTNPFLRCNESVIKKAAEEYAGHSLVTPPEIFAILREWKNNFS